MTPTTKQLCEEYEELSRTIKESEARRDEMKRAIIELFPDTDTVLDTGTAKFSLVVKKSWKYSESTKQAEVELKETKKNEEMMGVAEAVLAEPYLMCKTV